MEEQSKNLQSRDLFASAFKYAAIGMALVSPQGQFLHVNQALCNMLGYTEKEMLGLSFQIITHKDDLETDLQYVEQMLRGEINTYQMEKRYIAKSGESIWILLSVSLVLDEAKNPLVFISQIQDISERKRVEASLIDQYKLIAFQASHDKLTTLENREAMEMATHHAIEKAKQQNAKVALILFDIDRFKDINDTHSHAVGDALLQHLVTRTQKLCSQYGYRLARLGGDEFAILLEDIADFYTPGQFARTLFESLKKSYKIDKTPIKISVSAGIACYPDITQSAEELLANSTIALTNAKRQGGNHYQYFSETLQKTHKKRITLQGEFEQALANHELTLHFQPIIEMATGKVAYAEALLRWEKDEKTLLMPDDFLPMIELPELLTGLRDFVLHESAQCIKFLKNRMKKPFRININLSPEQLERTKPSLILSTLELMDADPRLLGIEITESALMRNLEQTKNTLKTLQSQGIKVIIDDFGTGYSSLSLLHNLPFDGLKIDKSFIRASSDNLQADTFINAIINLAQALNLPTVAEGVETQAQLDHLKALGCQYAQGFLFAKAMPFDEFIHFAQERNQKTH